MSNSPDQFKSTYHDSFGGYRPGNGGPRQLRQSTYAVKGGLTPVPPAAAGYDGDSYNRLANIEERLQAQEQLAQSLLGE